MSRWSVHWAGQVLGYTLNTGAATHHSYPGPHTTTSQGLLKVIIYVMLAINQEEHIYLHGLFKKIITNQGAELEAINAVCTMQHRSQPSYNSMS